jgi:hypothetical protein
MTRRQDATAQTGRNDGRQDLGGRTGLVVAYASDEPVGQAWGWPRACHVGGPRTCVPVPLFAGYSNLLELHLGQQPRRAGRNGVD